MAEVLLTVQNNTAPKIRLTLARSVLVNGRHTDQPIVLSAGDSVHVIIQSKSTGAVTNVGHQNAVTITDGPNGKVTYAQTSGDFPKAGRYIADAHIFYADGGDEVIYEQAFFDVRSRLPIS